MEKDTNPKNNVAAIKLFCLLMVMVVLSACTPSHKGRLQQIESMLDKLPDTAWVMLCQDSARLGEYSKCDRMKYLLLRTEAMNKLFYALDTIDYMDEVLAYYSSHGNAEDKAQANYMMGSVYRDRGNSPKAVQYYNEAIVQLDTTKNANYLLLSRIYGQMANVYRLQRYPQMEEKMCRNNAFYAMKAKDTLGYIQALEYSASVFHQLGKMDSVYQIASRSYLAYKKMGRDDYAASALTPLTEIYLRNRDYVKAKQALEEYREKSMLLDKNGNPVYPGVEFFYNYLGWYYKDVGNRDSALWCYRKLLNYPSEIGDLEAGYRGLMSVYSQMGKLDSVVKYAYLYANANDTANFRNSAEEVSKVQALFDYTESQNVAIQKAEEAKNIWRALFFAFFVIVALTVIIMKIKARNQKLQIRYKDIENNLVLSKEKIKNKEEEIFSLNRQLSVYQTNANEEIWNKENALMDSKLVQSFLLCADMGKQPMLSEWKDFHVLVEKTMPGFWNQLFSLKDFITDDEFKLCLLTRLSFTPSQIANLLGISKQSVTNRRRKLVKVLFNSTDSKSFDAFVKHIN